MSKTVVGLMNSEAQAQDAMRELLDKGFESDAIGLMSSHSTSVTVVATSGDDTAETKSGAAKGIGIGAAFGGVGGLLVGLAGLSIPGIGPIVAAGPIASALAGAGIGAVTGGTIGALRRLGVPEQDAHYYAEGVRRGGVLVTADASDDDEARIAADVLRNHDAADIEQLARTWRQEGWQGFDEAAGPYMRDRGAANDSGPARYTGVERRRHTSSTYSGPERRAA